MKFHTDTDYLVLRKGRSDSIYLEDLMSIDREHDVNDGCGLLWELYPKKNMSLAYVKVIGTGEKHKHLMMDETYRVEKGEGLVIMGYEEIYLTEGKTLQLPEGAVHYVKKIDDKPFELLVLNRPGFTLGDYIIVD